MSEKALLIAREQIISVINKCKPSLSYDETLDLANQLLDAIEWENPALMHKDIEWLTRFYLNQMVKA